MNEFKHMAVYEQLSRIVGVKFKARIKDCGIEFNEIYQLTDLVNDNNGYLLVLDNKYLEFFSTIEFVKKFIQYLKNNLNVLNEEYNALREKQSQPFYDEHQIFYEDERIGNHGTKQQALLNKFQKYLGSID